MYSQKFIQNYVNTDVDWGIIYPPATLNNGTDSRWFGLTVQGSIPATGFVFTPCFSHGTGEQTDKRHQHTVLRPLETTVRCHFNNNPLDITTHYVLSSLQVYSWKDVVNWINTGNCYSPRWHFDCHGNVFCILVMEWALCLVCAHAFQYERAFD